MQGVIKGKVGASQIFRISRQLGDGSVLDPVQAVPLDISAIKMDGTPGNPAFGPTYAYDVVPDPRGYYIMIDFMQKGEGYLVIKDTPADNQASSVISFFKVEVTDTGESFNLTPVTDLFTTGQTPNPVPPTLP